MSHPEFPTTYSVRQDGDHFATETEWGMELRDYFAAKAMAAMIGTSTGPVLGGLDGSEERTAAAAYRMANAMLTERNRLHDR